MNKILFIICIILSACLNADIFQSVPVDKATFIKNDETKYFCSNCGMNLAYYYKTNYIYKNEQYASLHCLYEATKGKIPQQDVKVVDVSSLKFIDATKAFYVVGSNKPGTMTANSKYAFKTKEDAQKFIEKNGGKLVNFQEAYDLASADFQQDIEMIKKKREKKVYKLGKKLYQKNCTNINAKEFDKIDRLKLHVKENCKTAKEKELQAILVYLWDIQKQGKPMRTIQTILVPQKERCPICGMVVDKYSKWVAKVVKDNKEYYFDGPKDMLKFIFQFGKDKFKEIYVTDYFTGKQINAKKSYFVIGSDVYGPMGKELVAFESDEVAYNFKNEHFGKKVLIFSEITEEILIYLQ